MAHRHNDTNEPNNANEPNNTDMAPAGVSPRPRHLLICAAATVVVLILFIALWKLFFVYVPPGKGLVIVAKTGTDLGPNQVLAKKGQKGVQEEVLGEGYHFVWPILYTTELHDLTVVPPGQVGVVTNLGGDRPPDRPNLGGS